MEGSRGRDRQGEGQGETVDRSKVEGGGGGSEGEEDEERGRRGSRVAREARRMERERRWWVLSLMKRATCRCYEGKVAEGREGYAGVMTLRSRHA